MNWLKSSRAKRTYFGIAFGFLFPIVGTLLEIYLVNLPYSINSAILVHQEQPILWIINLAPVVLGIAFNIIGKQEQELQQTNKNLNITIQNLGNLQEELEQRVEQRTNELHSTVTQLQTIAQVTQAIAGIQKLDEQLKQISELISTSFDIYHTGIFLIDQRGEYAVLQATNSPGGQRMLKRRHQLKVGTQGIVGFVTGRGQARIALDVGTDAIFFDNPDLPETRSEIALPLKVAGETFGAIDLQSTQPNAFGDDDVRILMILADQVAIAIHNSRLFEQSRRANEEVERTHRQTAKQTWHQFINQKKVLGYEYDGLAPKPITELSQNESALNLPLELRGQNIGTLKLSAVDRDHAWTEDELAKARAVAERTAIAIENARLLEESQKRAVKEQTISQLSASIASSVDLDSILRATAQGIGNTIPGTEVSIRLNSTDEK